VLAIRLCVLEDELAFFSWGRQGLDIVEATLVYEYVTVGVLDPDGEWGPDVGIVGERNFEWRWRTRAARASRFARWRSSGRDLSHLLTQAIIHLAPKLRARDEVGHDRSHRQRDRDGCRDGDREPAAQAHLGSFKT
jgi:hypothetical protein